MTFRVGQKVAQVRDWKPFRNPYPDVEFTRCGVTYTIREILEIDGTPALRFFEIRNATHKYKNRGTLEQPFPAWNFRPIVERETSIEFAHKILNKVSRKHKERA